MSTDVLYSNRCSKYWNDAMPIGNGRVGAMVFGDVQADRLALPGGQREFLQQALRYTGRWTGRTTGSSNGAALTRSVTVRGTARRFRGAE